MSQVPHGNLYPDDSGYRSAENYAQRLTEPETDSDTELRHDVEQALANAPIDTSHLEVCVRDGRALIFGSVGSPEDEEIIVQRAWGVAGVTDVQSQVLVEH